MARSWHTAAVAVVQLYALGFSAQEVDRLVDGGAFVRRHRGVLLDARAPATQRGQLVAALLALGPSAFLSHRTRRRAPALRSPDTRRVTRQLGRSPTDGVGSPETRAELDRLIAEAARRPMLDPEKIEKMLGRHSGRPGTNALRAALCRLPTQPRRQIPAGARLRRLAATLPDIPAPERNAISISRVTEFRFAHDSAGVEADLRHFLAGDRAA